MLLTAQARGFCEINLIVLFHRIFYPFVYTFIHFMANFSRF